MTYPERIVADETEPGVVALHLKRYVFAEAWCRDKIVLDAACGTGYGSSHLARVAERVVGVDFDRGAVAYARDRYRAPNLAFEEMDVADLRFDDASFDVVCSFETIEHLPDRDAFLRAAARVLRPDGVFLVSTPHAAQTTHRPANPHHHIEYARADFERLLRNAFSEVELYGQRRLETRRHRLARRLDVLGLRRRLALVRRASALTGTPATESATLDDVVIERHAIDRATEIVAVCRGPRRP